MENRGSEFSDAPFPHELLDEQAAKVSQLILAVQERCRLGDEQAAADLFFWAEECWLAGNRSEAEFLYLHSINVSERYRAGMTRIYPIVFLGLREYAQSLLAIACESQAA